MKLKPLVGQVAVMVSPTLSNEDLMAALAFSRDVLQVKSVFVSGRPHGQGDHFLVTADKNPNRKGLEWIAKGLGVALEPFSKLEAGLESGSVKGLVGFGQDVPVSADVFAEKAKKLELFVLTATNETKLTAEAHALLAASSHVEDEGTFTQEAGITQRVRRAFPPKGDSAPVWRWAAQLGTELGKELKPTNSRDVFKMLAPSVPELASYEWDKLAPMNQAKPGITTLAAAADGRPMGWREQGAPNIRGLSMPKGT
jgi:NADH-quinone oxidoreductase subunit G